MVRIKLVSALSVIKREQSLPGSFVIRLDASRGDVRSLRAVIPIQFVVCESQKDMTMRRKELGRPPGGKAAGLRMVVLGILIHKRLSFFGGSLVVFRL